MSELDICTARDDDAAAAAAAATVVEYVGSTNSLDAFALRSQHQLHTYEGNILNYSSTHTSLTSIIQLKPLHELDIIPSHPIPLSLFFLLQFLSQPYTHSTHYLPLLHPFQAFKPSMSSYPSYSTQFLVAKPISLSTMGKFYDIRLRQAYFVSRQEK